MRHSPFIVSVDKCNGSYNTLNDPPRRLKNRRSTFECILYDNWKNEWNILIRHIWCSFWSKFDIRKCNLNQSWNKNKYQCECKHSKEHLVCKEDYATNPSMVACEIDYSFENSYWWFRNYLWWNYRYPRDGVNQCSWQKTTCEMV